MKISFFRRYRSNRLFFERQPTYINFGWGSPSKHCWWALSIYIYFA